jgi:hypothetical protein
MTYFGASVTVVWGDDLQKIVNHCAFYVLGLGSVDYTISISYTEGDYLSIVSEVISGGNQWPVNKTMIY